MSGVVQRVTHYLTARKNMHQVDQGAIHSINPGGGLEAELRTEDIESLLQQRAELLEALKKFVKAGQESKSTLEFSNMCDEFIEYAVYAIAKAEAAE